ncbi:hypothetical protein CEXT_224161 [Caerostris extrusa]|uniref:Uncharacterized protein n=1 Tax=Caerostris extrusa TaxID=172846 RepID=A0AAV4MSD4_CAEEX|nr:hypothetical protein CEXT_224161 [Caerostris extrusa]
MNEKDLEVVFANRYAVKIFLERKLGMACCNGRSSTCFYPWRKDCGDLCRNRTWSAYLGHWPVLESSLDRYCTRRLAMKCAFEARARFRGLQPRLMVHDFWKCLRHELFTFNYLQDLFRWENDFCRNHLDECMHF